MSNILFNIDTTQTLERKGIGLGCKLNLGISQKIFDPYAPKYNFCGHDNLKIHIDGTEVDQGNTPLSRTLLDYYAKRSLFSESKFNDCLWFARAANGLVGPIALRSAACQVAFTIPEFWSQTSVLDLINHNKAQGNYWSQNVIMFYYGSNIVHVGTLIQSATHLPYVISKFGGGDGDVVVANTAQVANSYRYDSFRIMAAL